MRLTSLQLASAATPDPLLKTVSGLVPVRRYEDATVKAADVLLLSSDACGFAPALSGN